jgi:hypothetical protein
VQAIGSYDQIEAARRLVPETDPYLRLALLDRFNAITKDGLNPAIQFAIDPLSEVSTQNAKELKNHTPSDRSRLGFSILESLSSRVLEFLRFEFLSSFRISSHHARVT